MKKNFVQKLALGLALVMTVTSVPATSKAAAKPVFKAASVEVEEGATVKTVIKNTKGWKAKKVVVKDGTIAEATAVQKAKKVNVKVTGLKAGETKVVTKLTNGKKVVKAKLNVTVTAKEVKEAALTSVEATGAKKLTLTLSAAADVKAADLKIKKGNATPNIADVKVDGTTVVVTLGSKMTAGTYEVTYKEVTKEVTVKDETLTTLSVIGTNLVADASLATKATISYHSLNQYGERMVAPGTVTVTSSFGSATTTKIANAKKDGVIEITGIPTMLAVIGQTGTVVLVDNKTGVSSSATVEYSAPATLSSLEVLGMYNMDELKYANIIEGNDIADFVLVIKGSDQYGVEMDKTRIIADSANIALTATPILSNVTIAGTTIDATNLTEVEIDGTVYPALKLSGGTKATAGSLNLIVVNTKKGTLLSTTYEITKSVVVKSVTITPSDTVYAGSPVVMDYEVIDQDGNAITSYKVLKNVLTLGSRFDLSKNQDGTATLYYTGAATGYEGNVDTFRMSKPVTETVYAHMGTANMVVSTVSLTVFTQKIAQEVTNYTGLTACASTSGSIAITHADIVVEDQYGNAMVPGVDIPYTLSNVNYRIIENDGVDSFVESAGSLASLYNATYDCFFLTSAGNQGTATLYLDLQDDLSVPSTSATVEAIADTEVDIATVDASKATSLSVTKVNGGWVVNEQTASVAYTPVQTLTASAVTVYGRVGNYTIQIPTSMYDVTGDTFKGFDKATIDAKSGLSKETVEVSVYTDDETVVIKSEYTRSNMVPELNVLKFATTSVTSPVINGSVLNGLVVAKDQYGNAFSLADVKYDVTLKSATANEDNIEILKNQTGNVTLTGLVSGSTVKLYVTVSLKGKTVTKLVTVTV